MKIESPTTMIHPRYLKNIESLYCETNFQKRRFLINLSQNKFLIGIAFNFNSYSLQNSSGTYLKMRTIKKSVNFQRNKNTNAINIICN